MKLVRNRASTTTSRLRVCGGNGEEEEEGKEEGEGGRGGEGT